jgi:two-component system nitrogen regulation response regulator GlnG
MINSDFTFTSPLLAGSQGDDPLLALSIAWHPDASRIGEQFLWADPAATLELSRFLPLFRRPGADGDGLGLGYGGVSRTPLKITQDHEGIVIHPADGSRMALEINGADIAEPSFLSRQQIEDGVVLNLGRAVLVCLHWMHCLPKHNPVDGWLGIGSAAIGTRDMIRQVATTDGAVLLLGETGTGKEVAARAIHGLSRRSAARMVSVNMAALNESLAAADLFGASRGAYTGAQAAREGLFAEAQGATLFLDEVGNTPATVQPMLLRVLETGDYRPLGAARDVQSTARLIAATDQDLYGAGFNQALLRRLESFTIRLPPLRSRREDIGLLIAHLLAASKQAGGADMQLPAALVAQFILYDWPGNVRQLTHAVKRLLLTRPGDALPDFHAIVDARPALRASAAGGAAAGTGAGAGTAAHDGAAPVRRRLADLDEGEVLAAMEKSEWYIQGAAQALGISRPSMYKLLEAHPQIRSLDRISLEEIRQAVIDCGGDVEQCASRLKTPAEPLRRHLRLLKLAS